MVGKNKIYVGGGVTEDENMFAILEYNPHSDSWKLHSPSQVVLYGLSYFQENLITVGGSNIDGVTATISGYDRLDKVWVESIKPMPTARCTSTVICTDLAIIVCGGAVLDDSLNPIPCRLVEVYNSENSQWHATSLLPHPYAGTSFALINDYCFLVGEATETEGGHEVTYAMTKDLIEPKRLRGSSKSVSSSGPQPWKELSQSPLVGSAAVSFNGALVTLGGEDHDGEGDTLSLVYVFVARTNSWVRLRRAMLPEPRAGSSAVPLSDGRVVVVGGHDPDGKNCATAFIGTMYD